jgi:hypothetical protein
MPSDFVKRRLFSRVVLWDTKGGTILDLPTRYVLPGANPVESEEYVDLANGSQTPIRRTHEVNIPITSRELDVMGEVIQRTKCPVKAAFIGPSGTDNFLWLEPTRLQVTDPETDPGEQARKVLKLKSNVFYAGIWEGSDLISGVPWQGTQDYKNPENSRVEMRMRGEQNIRKGYKGPIWEIASSNATGRKVDLVGNTSDITDSTPAIIRFEFPVWGAKIKLDSPPGYEVIDATIRALDFDGNTMVSDSGGDGATIKMPKESWFIEVELKDTEARPKVKVERSNEGAEYTFGSALYVGDYVPDCNRTENPSFDNVLDPNVPPKWLQKETVKIDKTVKPPVWEDRQDLLIGAFDNTAPTWDDKDKLQAANSLIPDDQPPTWENRENLFTGGEIDYDRGVEHYTPQDTQKVYTHENGFSEFDYPDGNNYNIINTDIADGQLESDGVVGKTFIARDDGIYVEETSSYILDTSGNSSKNVRGLATDPVRNRVYFTYSGTNGIFYTSYDGSTGENNLTTNLGAVYYLAFEPNKEYIFAASRANNEIVRFNADPNNLDKTVIKDDTDVNGTVYEEIKICTSEEVIVWQDDDYSEVILNKSDYDGSNTFGLVVTNANVEVDTFKFAVADKEKVALTVSEVEGGFCSVNFYAIDNTVPAYEPPDFNIDNADTGKRVSTSKNYTTDNTVPSFDNKASLEFSPLPPEWENRQDLVSKTIL